MVLDEPIVVREGDCLGFANENDTGLVGHSFEAVNLYYSNKGEAVVKGDILEFDILSFPYKFALAATYTLKDGKIEVVLYITQIYLSLSLQRFMTMIEYLISAYICDIFTKFTTQDMLKRVLLNENSPSL